MAQSSSLSALPQLVIFSSNPLLLEEFSRETAAQGLPEAVVNPSNGYPLTQDSVVAWLVSSLPDHAPEILTTLSNPSNLPAKVIITFPIDSPKDQRAQVDEETSKINGYIAKITDLCHQKQIDVRFIAHHSLYGHNQIGEGSPLSLVLLCLQSGSIPLNSELLFPISASDLSAVILRLWFDRGHRNQKILVKGQSFSFDSLQFLPNNPPYSKSPLHKFWSAGEGINPDDVVEIKSDISILLSYLQSQYLPPKPKDPDPLPKINHETRPKPEPSPRPQVASPPPPKVIATPRTVLSPRPSKSPNKYLRLGIIGVISSSLAYVLVTYGLYFLAFMRTDKFNPQSGDSIDNFSQELQLAHASYQKLSILPIFDHFFDAKYITAQKSLLRRQIDFHFGAAIDAILGNADADPYSELSRAKFNLDRLYQLESQFPSSPQTIADLQSLRQFLVLYPQLFPENQKITALLLFQNNLELRPTGGFIGSIGLLTVDRGKILNLETRNIYDLDSNLRGLVTPPEEVRKFLGESSWYFRDSNWNPDFVEAASSANWFLDKEWGSRADLIIGLNTNTLALLVASVGNQENLATTALDSQDSIASSSSQPEYLSLIASSLLNQLGRVSSEVKLKFASSLYKSLVVGEMTLVSTKPQLNQILDDLRLTGSIYSPSCPQTLTTPCFADHFYLSEANVGINKANYYLNRSSSHQLASAPDGLAHTHTLNLENTSPNSTWPAGAYKAYYRAYLPPTATDIKVAINDQFLQNDELSLLLLPTARQVGWFYSLPPQSKASLVLSYTLPTSMPASYQLFVQKQPGLPASTFTFDFVGKLVAPETVTLDGHHLFSVKISP